MPEVGSVIEIGLKQNTCVCESCDLLQFVEYILDLTCCQSQTVRKLILHYPRSSVDRCSKCTRQSCPSQRCTTRYTNCALYLVVIIDTFSFTDFDRCNMIVFVVRLYVLQYYKQSCLQAEILLIVYDVIVFLYDVINKL